MATQKKHKPETTKVVTVHHSDEESRKKFLENQKIIGILPDAIPGLQTLFRNRNVVITGTHLFYQPKAGSAVFLASTNLKGLRAAMSKYRVAWTELSNDHVRGLIAPLLAKEKEIAVVEAVPVEVTPPVILEAPKEARPKKTAKKSALPVVMAPAVHLSALTGERDGVKEGSAKNYLKHHGTGNEKKRKKPKARTYPKDFVLDEDAALRLVSNIQARDKVQKVPATEPWLDSEPLTEPVFAALLAAANVKADGSSRAKN